jgi:hypothetical protein
MFLLNFFIIALKINIVLGLSMIFDQPLRALLVISGITQQLSD